MLSALTIDSDNLSQQNIYTSLKQSKPEAQYRIRCILQSDQPAIGYSSMANGNHGSGGGGGDMAEVKKEAAKVTKKINEANEKLDNLESQVKICCMVALLC